jgi:hypothetical protein
MSAPLSLEGLLAVCERVQVSHATCLAAGPLVNSDPEKVQAIVNEWMAATKEYGSVTGPEVVRALVRVAQCAKALDDGLLDTLDCYRAAAVLCEALNEALGGIEGVVK